MQINMFVEPSYNHQYCRLEELTEEITSHFTERLKTADEKITDISKLEMECWQMIDEIGGKCSDWIKEIEQIRDQQV